MTKEKEVIGRIVTKWVESGAADEIVVAILETSLEDNLAELERLNQRKYLEAHHWQDYADCLTASKSMVRVLQYFTVNHYYEEENLVHYYAQRLEVL